jgi:hypothetical protein
VASETFACVSVQLTGSTLQEFSLEFNRFMTNKFPAYKEVRYHVYKSPPLGPILNPVNILTPYPFKFELNNIFHVPYYNMAESLPHHYTIHVLEPFQYYQP